MSSELAIASVTAVLKRLLENGLVELSIASSVGSDVQITTLPPDRVSVGADERPQLNLFMYQTTPNTSHRAYSRNGSRRQNDERPLALDLHYLLSAYGALDMEAEILLGYTLRLFRKYSVLHKDTVRSVLTSLTSAGSARSATPTLAALSAPGLLEQVEEIAIQLSFLSTEEMSRLWSALQARFRPSAVYKVSLVLIDDDE